jgi:hypothetical protein
VWAVGYSADSQQSSSVNKTLIEHWDGEAWSIVPSPNPTPHLAGGYPVSNELYSVTVAGPDDVWAVGQSYNIQAGQVLILHWNGRRWANVPVRVPGQYSDLRGVSAVAPDDVWAVGNRWHHGLQVTLVEHWDGNAWTMVPSPNDGPFLQMLMQVDARAAEDVWAVGWHVSVFGFSQPYQNTILHWDGAAWSVVPSPDVNTQNGYLWDVVSLAKDDAWAVGFYDTGTALRTVTEHWDGEAWSIVPSPNAHTTIDELTGVAATPDGDVWAVGESFDDLFSFATMAQRFTSCAG